MPGEKRGVPPKYLEPERIDIVSERSLVIEKTGQDNLKTQGKWQKPKTMEYVRDLREGLEDGIYEMGAGEWLVVENDAEKKQTIFRAPDYDLNYLLRAYKTRLQFRGALEGSKEVQQPSVAKLEEHLPSEFKGFGFVDDNQTPGGLSKSWVKERLDKVDALLDKIKKNTPK